LSGGSYALSFSNVRRTVRARQACSQPKKIFTGLNAGRCCRKGRVVQSQGLHGTSLNEIAASLGVTRAALYHYFPNKNTLVLTITGYVAELIDELNCCVVLMEEQALEPEDRAKLVRERDKFERALRALVREGIADGSVAPCDPKLAVFVILGAMNWVPKWQAERRLKPEQLTRALGDIFDARFLDASCGHGA
jgi:AcrR family transcriptional regulator